MGGSHGSGIAAAPSIILTRKEAIMPGFRVAVKTKKPVYKEDTMMAQSGIKPAPEMVQMMKDRMKREKTEGKK